MNTIPITRYNLSRFQKSDKRRCSEAYALVKQHQARLESRGTTLMVDNQVMCLAASHFRTGVVLRKYKLFSLACEQFDRAHELLALL